MNFKGRVINVKIWFDCGYSIIYPIREFIVDKNINGMTVTEA